MLVKEYVGEKISYIDEEFSVENHFTAHCEIIFAVIILQFAVIDLQNVLFAVK